MIKGIREALERIIEHLPSGYDGDIKTIRTALDPQDIISQLERVNYGERAEGIEAAIAIIKGET